MRKANRTDSTAEIVYTASLSEAAESDPRRLKAGLEANAGIRRAEINLLADRLHVHYDPRLVTAAQIEAALRNPDQRIRATGLQRLRRLCLLHGAPLRLLCATVFLALSFLLWGNNAQTYAFPSRLYVLLNGIVLLMGLPIFVGAIARIFREKRPSIDFLVLLIAAGAVGIGNWLEAATIVFVALAAATLDAAVARRARRVLSPVSILGTRSAAVRVGDAVESRAASELIPGDVVVVGQGGMIPVDGTVVSGHAQVKESAITGESTFSVKGSGDRVFAGGIVESGGVDVRADVTGEDTALGRIDSMIGGALAKPGRTERLVERWAGVLVWGVIGFGIAVFALFGQHETFAAGAGPLHALPKALAAMVAICPFAVILASPLMTYACILRAARRGIVFKGADTLERLAGIGALLMDKTGTLTYARPTVADLKAFGGRDPIEVASAALFVEQRSHHPIARAICEYVRPLGATASEPDRFHEFEGGGAGAILADRHIKVGAFWFMDDGRDIPSEVTAWIDAVKARGCTPVLVADPSDILGGFVIADQVREDAVETLRKLKRDGIERIVMVTGDNAQVAAEVQQRLALDDVRAECMPDTKIEAIRQERSLGRAVGMVGDGINDAPALAEADVGIAMASMGSDAAIEAADVALLRDDLRALAEAYSISRLCLNAIRGSIVLTLLVNAVLAALAVLGTIALLAGTLLQGAILGLVALLALTVYSVKV